MNIDLRVLELVELAESEGIDLPYAPGLIVALEDLGAIVDLLTGEIHKGSADEATDFEVTVFGEVVAYLLSKQVNP
jgi:hypothetical protein